MQVIGKMNGTLLEAMIANGTIGSEVYTHTYIYIHTCINMYMYNQTYIHIYVNICMYIDIYRHIHTYTYVYIHICIYM